MVLVLMFVECWLVLAFLALVTERAERSENNPSPAPSGIPQR